MKKIISIITITIFLGACVSEDRFKDINRSGNSITSESLAQDLNFGSRFPNILRDIGFRIPWGDAQYGVDWGPDNFMRHTGTPLDEAGGRDMMSYYMVDYWNEAIWNTTYNSVMAPANVNKAMALEANAELFAAWAELFQVIALSRATVYYGPLIYSEYGEPKKQFDYDSEEFLYEQFFDKLDYIQSVFQTSANNNAMDLVKFDASYEGDLAKWLKMINSLRLRLAMRIVKADPVLAKAQGEKAIQDPVGLILSNADNFNTSLLGGAYPVWTMSEDWGDCRMGSGMEEVLIGYEDPRIHVFFQPVDDEDSHLYADHPAWPYKGIAGGAYLNVKDNYIPFSRLGTYFSPAGPGGSFRKILTAAEVHFILAEAKLRGWSGLDKSVQEYYEDGVRTSWLDWGAVGDVEAYLADDVKTPIDYVDPTDERNSYNTKITLTIKWDESAGNEEKLERIMMQKWIDAFQKSNEMWSDHRRTGYPRLSDVSKNDSNETWGIIQPGDVLKRYIFILRERQNNAAGVEEATAKLGPGGNKISTRLWIHPDKPNF
jgi:hypothetical protein